MGVADWVKGYAQKKLVGEFLKSIDDPSLKNLIRMTRIAERITRCEDDKGKARALRRYFEEGHPSLDIAMGVIRRLSPNCRRKFIENLFVNAFLIGNSMREHEIYENEGFIPPTLIVISPTMRCNLKCIGCYAGEYEQNYGLSFELLDRILTEAKELGIYFITMTGGEVFVRKDIFDIWEKHNDMYFQLYTNGTLIDEEAADRLEKLGNVAPMISVEGFKEETDSRRGEGVYDKVMAAMDNLRERGVLFGASITETKYNMDIITSEELIDHLIEKGVMVIWYFQYMPIGRGPTFDLMPTPEQRDLFRRKVAKLRDVKPVFIADFWNDGPYVGGCIAGGKHYLHINANGDVEPCVFCHFAVDNIKDKSLKEVLNSDLFKMIRSRQPYRDNLLTPCMLIDRPEVSREIVEKTGAYFTHEGADCLFTELRDKIDQYALSYREIADKVWYNDEKYAKYVKRQQEERREREGETEKEKVGMAVGK